MFYVPSQFINDNNLYSYNSVNNKLTVYEECENNQCVCTDIFPDFDYNVSQSYTCNVSHETLLNSIPTDNYYYRKDFWSILVIFIVFCFIIIYCPLKILFRFFRRFDFS